MRKDARKKKNNSLAIEAQHGTALTRAIRHLDAFDLVIVTLVTALAREMMHLRLGRTTRVFALPERAPTSAL